MKSMLNGSAVFRIAVLAVGLLTAAPAFAQKVDPEVMVPITKFVNAFNKGDMAAAAATATPEAYIIDEFPPHLWTGAKAMDAWATDYGKNASATGVTEGIVTISKPTRYVAEKDHAYVIVPAVYTYKEKDVPMIEKGQLTISLRHAADGWKITAWTWSGPNPTAVKTTKPQ